MGNIVNTIYGSDLQLTRQGDILVNSSGRLAIISGIDNLKQAIRILLGTPQGWFFEEPEYGSRLEKYWGKPNTPQNRYAAARDMQEALMADPRIAKVTKLFTKQMSLERFDIEAMIVAAGQTDELNYVHPIQIA